ncbi:MAG: fasciclin domain-containing protein [Hyphomonadaceae bacterium]|nr:fasciclin domain-containing protein [Hyphomonadaceae bacterium]
MNRVSFTRALVLALAVTATPAAFAQTDGRFVVAISDTETNTPDPQGDVIDVAAATGQFSYFLDAVEQTGYAETLRGEGPFTIFAPTDEAFRSMSERERTRLFAPENRDELLALLAYHVVDERVTSESTAGGVTREEASNGYTLTIDGRDGLRVYDQLVVMPDINASNGVIQGINSVLSPPVMVASAD